MTSTSFSFSSHLLSVSLLLFLLFVFFSPFNLTFLSLLSLHFVLSPFNLTFSLPLSLLFVLYEYFFLLLIIPSRCPLSLLYVLYKYFFTPLIFPPRYLSLFIPSVISAIKPLAHHPLNGRAPSLPALTVALVSAVQLLWCSLVRHCSFVHLMRAHDGTLWGGRIACWWLCLMHGSVCEKGHSFPVSLQPRVECKTWCLAFHPRPCNVLPDGPLVMQIMQPDARLFPA